MLNIFNKRLDKLNEELKSSTDGVNYKDISTILIKLSNAVSDGNVNRYRYRSLLRSACLTL